MHHCIPSGVQVWYARSVNTSTYLRSLTCRPIVLDLVQFTLSSRVQIVLPITSQRLFSPLSEAIYNVLAINFNEVQYRTHTR